MPVEKPGKLGAPVIWCDFGGVLTAPAAETAATFCARVGVPVGTLVAAMRAVAGRYGTDDVMEPLDTPLVDAPGWAAQVEQVLRDDHQVHADLSDFAEHWFAGRPANTALIEVLTELKAAGIFVGMLSNMVPAFEPYWPAMVAPELFDDLVFSYRVGVRKPDRAIYDLSAARASARASDCVLIDDLPQNCAGARKAGWSAVEFTGNDDAIPLLRSLLAGFPGGNFTPGHTPI
jgi:putative hydrolase of the HAD superfamily